MAHPPRRDRAAREAPPARRRFGWLIGLGTLAVVLFTIATLPATLLAGRLERYGVTALAWSGSIWSGTATGLAWRGASLGDLRWHIAPLALLRARLGARVDLLRSDGTAGADLNLARSGDAHLSDVKVDLPVESMSALPLGFPKGWRGRIRVDLPSLDLVAGWPSAVRGTIDMDGLIAPPPRSTSIGSYHVVLPDPAASSTVKGITAAVADKEGPFSVAGRLTLSPDRSFLLEGTLAPRGETPPALQRSLQLLGPADATGRRPFSVSGTL